MKTAMTKFGLFIILLTSASVGFAIDSEDGNWCMTVKHRNTISGEKAQLLVSVLKEAGISTGKCKNEICDLRVKNAEPILSSKSGVIYEACYKDLGKICCRLTDSLNNDFIDVSAPETSKDSLASKLETVIASATAYKNASWATGLIDELTCSSRSGKCTAKYTICED